MDGNSRGSYIRNGLKTPLFLQCLQGKHAVVMIQDQEAQRAVWFLESRCKHRTIISKEIQIEETNYTQSVDSEDDSSARVSWYISRGGLPMVISIQSRFNNESRFDTN